MKKALAFDIGGTKIYSAIVDETGKILSEPEKFSTPKEVKVAETVTNVIEETNIPLVKLDNHTCRWPLGDPRDDDFCFCLVCYFYQIYDFYYCYYYRIISFKIFWRLYSCQKARA